MDDATNTYHVSVDSLPDMPLLSLNLPSAIDVEDRPARLLGHTVVDNFPAPTADQQVHGTVAVSNLPATQPVSGSVSVSNLPATQPVSGTVAVSNLPATQPVSIAAPVDTSDRAARLLGHVQVDNTVPVTGAFFPATQPVSGTVAVSNLPATQPVSGAVSVSNFPATQPVSIAAPLDVSDRAARLVGHVQVDNTVPVTGAFFPATQPVSGTVGVNNFPATQPVSGSVSVSNFPATQPVTFSNPVRTQIMLSWERLAGVVAESALTNFTNGTKAGVALGAATSYTVSAGKTLRITSVNINIVATSGVEVNSRLRIRQGAAVTNASPIIWQAETGLGSSAVVNLSSAASTSFPIPDGLEVPAGQQITFTHLESSAVGAVSLVIIGYEY
jgi:hypothetical protein